MESKIRLVSEYGFVCEIGRPKQMIQSDDKFGTFVNLTTFFEPIRHPIFLVELRNIPTVEHLSNIAYYGNETGAPIGGISVKLINGSVFESFVEDVRHALKMDDETNLEP